MCVYIIHSPLTIHTEGTKETCRFSHSSMVQTFLQNGDKMAQCETYTGFVCKLCCCFLGGDEGGGGGGGGGMT